MIRSKQDIRKCFLTIVTIAWIIFIFHNSMFSGPQSGAQSQGVLDFLIGIIKPLKMPFYLSDHLIRKTAHFIEYFVLGDLMTLTLWFHVHSFRKSIHLEAFLLLFIPVLDEFIQTFQIGRTSSAADILLDFSGAITGMALLILVFYIAKRKSDKISRKNNESNIIKNSD